MDINNGNCMKKLLTLCATTLFCSGNPRWRIQDITVKELKADWAKKVVLLDANGRERGPSHIPARLILPPPKTNWRLSCPRTSTPGSRLLRRTQCKAYEAAARAAEKLGYTNIDTSPPEFRRKEAARRLSPPRKAQSEGSCAFCRQRPTNADHKPQLAAAF